MTKSAKQEINQKIGQSIAKHLRVIGMTQAELAERLDLSLDTVSRLERGNIGLSVVRLFDLFELAETFSCETTDLLDEASPRPRDMARQLEELLTRVDDTDCLKLLAIVEQMVRMLRAKSS